MPRGGNATGPVEGAYGEEADVVALDAPGLTLTASPHSRIAATGA